MFCQSCVHFAFAHVAVHMFQSFVIRCIILNTHLCILCQSLPSKFCQWLEYHLYIDNMHQPLFLMLTELHPTATTYRNIKILSTGAYF